MLSSLKKLTSFSIKKKKLIDVASLQESLSEGLFDTMEKSFANRLADTKNSKQSPKDIEKIIANYSKRNMLLAASTSIVPGPLGILGAIPELLLNFGNQMNMIYDLGCAHGKETFINKDLLLDIPLSAFGGNTNLAQLQDIKKDLVDSPGIVLQNKAIHLGQDLVEKTLKKSVIQFVPVAGPVVMGLWSKMTTAKIAGVSTSFLSQQELFTEHFKPEENEEILIELQVQKIKGLANLIESNDDINAAQVAFITPIIENANLDIKQKAFLLAEAIKTGSNFDLNYQLLKDYEEDEALLLEMLILAKRSGSVDEDELNYIYQVASEFGYDQTYIDALVF